MIFPASRCRRLLFTLAGCLTIGGIGCSSKPAESDTAEVIRTSKSDPAATPNPVPTSTEETPAATPPAEPKP